MQVVVEAEGQDDVLVEVPEPVTGRALHKAAQEVLGTGDDEGCDVVLGAGGAVVGDGDEEVPVAPLDRVRVALSRQAVIVRSLARHAVTVPVTDVAFLAWVVSEAAERACVLALMLQGGVSRGAVDRAVLRAMAEGDPRGVGLELVDAGASVDTAGAEGDTLLLLAVKAGAAHAVAGLLRRGADATGRNAVTGASPLHAAAKYGHAHLVDLLIEAAPRRALTEATMLCDSTPLHLAAQYGHRDVCHRLLAAGVSLRETDRCGRTAVHLAAAAAAGVPLLELFVQRGTNGCAGGAGGAGGAAAFTKDWVVNHGDAATGKTPLMYAVENSRRDTAVWLVATQGAAVRAASAGATALHFAAALGDVAVARLLIGQGARPTSADASGETPLIAAAARGHSEMCKLLLSHRGVRRGIERATKDGATALLIAAQGEHAEACQTLVAHNADVNTKDRQQWTPLMWAAAGGLRGVCLTLLQRGAHVNVKNVYGNTPLSFACGAGLADVVEQLLAGSAEVNAANEDGWTPLMWAIEDGASHIATRLLECGAHVNATAADGTTPLRLAIAHGHADLIQECIRRGADPTGHAPRPFPRTHPLDCRSVAQRAPPVAHATPPAYMTSPMATPPVVSLPSPHRP